MKAVNWKSALACAGLALAMMWYPPISHHSLAPVIAATAVAGACGTWMDGIAVAVLFTIGSDLIKVFKGFTPGQILVLDLLAAPIWLAIGGVVGFLASWISSKAKAPTAGEVRQD